MTATTDSTDRPTTNQPGRTDQPHSRLVGGRLMPPTTANRDTIRADRADQGRAHRADRAPSAREAAAADRADALSEEVAASYEKANARGAAARGEGAIST